MTRRRAVKLSLWIGIPVMLLAGIVAFWDWDWFVPMVQARASAALGRTVTLRHLHMRLGRMTRITADEVAIANPPGWAGPPFATASHLVVEVDLWDYIRHGQLIIPLIALDQPQVRLVQAPDGQANYMLHLVSSSSGSGAKLGDVQIRDGHIAAQLAKLKADLGMDVQTQGSGPEGKVVINARGSYGGAPIEGRLIGGTILSLRDTAHPWPVDLNIQNGQTHASLVGTLQEPLHLKGADLKLQFAGQDMSQLTRLTGIPIPKTPPFRLTGALDFASGRVQFRNFAGQVGSSDLEGTIDVNPGQQKPEVVAQLQSRRVDLADLAGFLGTEPGRVSTPGQTPEKRAQVAQSESKSNLLPDKPLNIPQLHWADVHLRYRGQRIEGRSEPLDNLLVALDMVNGNIAVHPVSFGVGPGEIRINAALSPLADKALRAKADIDVRHVDVSKLMAATHMFHGAGTISGTGNVEGTGRSVAQILGNGNGSLRLGMAGGDLSAMLVDLSGLEFGNALLSALGVPQRTKVECMVDDMALRNGVVNIQALVLDTGEAIVNGTGTINLKNEALNLQLSTAAKHFSIGSFPAPINIAGSMKHPAIRPGAELAARGGIAAGLGVIFPPLALLPTIQLGVGDDHRCDRVLAQAKQQPGGHRLPSPDQQARAR